MNILSLIKKKVYTVKFKYAFNKWAPVYDNQVYKASTTEERMFGGYNRVLDKVMEYCGPEENSDTSVLDIGAGTGNLAARFQKYGMQVTGIEPSLKLRKICCMKYPCIKILPGDFPNYPHFLPQADLIVSACAFHHLTAAEKFKLCPR